MGEVQSKRFDEPDEVVSLPNLAGQVVVLGEAYVGRYVANPGWRWSNDVKPFVGTPSCQHHHQGFVVSGRMHVTTDAGATRIIGQGEVYDIPPGHDAWVVGDEPCVSIEFRGVRDWARPAATGEGVLVTLLLTDIVASTATATRLGDTGWKALLVRHYERVRVELDRFRGYEIKTLGDGVLALFDGTARAVRCAAAIAQAARDDGIEVRSGVHSGEVEHRTDNVQGIAVHVVARVAAVAGPGEVLLSDSTQALLEGSGLSFAEAGEYDLKGLTGHRRLFRLTSAQALT
jgi:class 3 adenylate cyclase